MTIEELNAVVETGAIDEFIRVCEAKQVKALSRIADDIASRRGTRIVLLAGASSAGKTTTAKRLCTQLRVDGLDALHLSTDDYFVGNSRNPRDENGDFDYETVEAVDVPRLSIDLARLLSGDSVHMRKFDFVAHEGFDEEGVSNLPADGVIVLEGIHALNPRMTEKLRGADEFKIFIEPRSQLQVFGVACLPPADGRLLRRLVRDNQFRKLSPLATFDMWPKVLAGERKWIDPFKGNADAFFDSGLVYELAVIKSYAAGLLEMVKIKRPEETKAEMLSALLASVLPADPAKVPGDSILRETIGGSLLEY